MQISKRSQIIGQYREAVSQLLDAVRRHRDLAKQFAAMKLQLEDSDFSFNNSNEGITVAEFTAAYLAMQDVENLLSSESEVRYGNLYKISH
jgi:hypothetical protein